MPRMGASLKQQQPLAAAAAAAAAAAVIGGVGVRRALWIASVSIDSCEPMRACTDSAQRAGRRAWFASRHPAKKKKHVER